MMQETIAVIKMAMMMMVVVIILMADGPKLFANYFPHS